MVGRRHSLVLVRVVEVATAVLLIGGSGLVYAGVAEPYISPPALVFGEVDVLALMIVGASLLVVRPSKVVRRRYWQATATEAGLTSETATGAETTEYTGTVGGRTVRARTGSTTALAPPNSKDGRAYTLVEAELTRETADGVILGPSEQDVAVTPYNVAAHPDCETAGLVGVSNSDGLARSVLTDRVQETLLDVDDLHQIYAGNAGVAGNSLPDDDRMVVGTPPGITRAVDAAHDDDMQGGDWLGGQRWVTHVTDGVTLDPEELRKQAEAVAAVADAFERTVDQSQAASESD